MIPLHHDLFFSAEQDLESGQYRVLAALQAVRQSFSKTVIYPHLGELAKLHQHLDGFLQQARGLRGAMPGALKGVDWDRQEVVYERPNASGMETVLALVEWGMPRVKETLDEGKTIFEFVEEQLEISTVGIQPSYQDEGYLIVLDRQRKAYHVLRYQLSLFTKAKHRYRSLSTRPMAFLPIDGSTTTPHRVKMDLMRGEKELPNPATYLLESGVEFPFEKTLLPVAKRKFMRYLAQQRGLA